MAATAQPGDSSFAGRYPRTVGVLILVALHLVFVAGPAMLLSVALPSPGGDIHVWISIAEWTGFKHEAASLLIGIVQLFYVIPAVLLTLKLRRPAVAKGIVLGAAATFLVNLGGCAFFAWQLSKIG